MAWGETRDLRFLEGIRPFRLTTKFWNELGKEGQAFSAALRQGEDLGGGVGGVAMSADGQKIAFSHRHAYIQYPDKVLGKYKISHQSKINGSL